ncbi:hypothetical protein [Methanolapillus africanus]
MSCSVYCRGMFYCPECFKSLGICTDSDDLAELDFLIAEENILRVAAVNTTKSLREKKQPVKCTNLSDQMGAN